MRDARPAKAVVHRDPGPGARATETRDDSLGSLADLLREVAHSPALDPELAARYDRLSSLPVALGDYQLIEEIGGGGMGRVFRGRDRALGREVAIKVMRLAGDAGEDELCAALDREARRTAALDHPRVVTIHDHGVDDGLAYAVLELVDGETLAARIARRRIDRRTLAGILADVLDGLEHAHERGIVHCDVKPQNIAIDRDGRATVLDFGLAAVEAAADHERTRGTPAYMAPEQWTLDRLTPAADVWATALVALECVTTRPVPRWATRSPAVDAATVSVPHPRHRALGPKLRLAQLARRDPALSAVLARALSESPGERPSAGELRDQLVAILAPPARRRARLALAVAAVAFAGALATAAYLAPSAPEMPATADGYFASRGPDARVVPRERGPDVTGEWRYTVANQLPFRLTIAPDGDQLRLVLAYERPPERTDVRPTVAGRARLVEVGGRLYITGDLDIADPALAGYHGPIAIELAVDDADHLRLTGKFVLDPATRQATQVSSFDIPVHRS